MNLKKIITEEPIKSDSGYILGNSGVDILIKILSRGISKLRGSRLTLTNNEVKDVINSMFRK